MGIVAFNWTEKSNGKWWSRSSKNDDNEMTLVMNRDNWGNRVITKASWDKKDRILCGRCEDNSGIKDNDVGTWLAISRRGRVAFLMSGTLLTDDVVPLYGCEKYPTEFLESDMSPREFAEHIVRRDGDKQNTWSYSLIVADMVSGLMVHIRKPDPNKPDVMIEDVRFGVHTLSPHEGLDSTHPKDMHLKHRFTQMIKGLGDDPLKKLKEFAEGFMASPVGEGDQEPVFVDKMLNHPDIQRGLGKQRYGTTSTTALLVKHTREVMFFERFRKEDGVWDTHNIGFNFQL
ncbi:hypothetical protein CARUB_v10028204mg [Capsella rubella]|uniref:Uncharacterized protein n=1 Tax=Capsella rubella TaxID=81985 RepID=R0GUL4_9BRAS|nr:uncharacterized protein LOC17876170 [Capsella rubella]EOA14878.1 hypothetical protein CARUB_v10028204mg [Capsella rubella]